MFRLVSGVLPHLAPSETTSIAEAEECMKVSHQKAPEAGKKTGKASVCGHAGNKRGVCVCVCTQKTGEQKGEFAAQLCVDPETPV